MIKLYNSLTKKKEELQPLRKDTINMYTCGVTVYSDCHIGHGRSIYIFEVIKRFLESQGYKVNFVRNITDVDDKIINKARSLQKDKDIQLNQAFVEVKDTYIDSYYKDLRSLGIPKADIEPKATENIKAMQEYIQRLIDKGFAYQTKGNVYFSVRKFEDYGKLSGKRIDELREGERIETDPFKKDPLDFALWKATKPEEPSWDSPWGKGRPGWHIECSVMSQKYLKTETLDIHGGGLDLIFPHHENELTQSEALSEKPFAKYWIHHGLITINRQKMSKSLNNFLTLKEAVDKYTSNALKIFYLSSHYRHPLDFNQEKMQESAKVEKRITDFYHRLNEYPLEEKLTFSKLSQIEDNFLKALKDDFNMPVSFSAIFQLIGTVNQEWQANPKNTSFFGQAKSLLKRILAAFLIEIKEDELTDDNIKEKIEQRESFRKEKKFSEADKIRQDLAEKNIILEDLPNGKTRWVKKSC